METNFLDTGKKMCPHNLTMMRTYHGKSIKGKAKEYTSFVFPDLLLLVDMPNWLKHSGMNCWKKKTFFSTKYIPSLAPKLKDPLCKTLKKKKYLLTFENVKSNTGQEIHPHVSYTKSSLVVEISRKKLLFLFLSQLFMF